MIDINKKYSVKEKLNKNVKKKKYTENRKTDMEENEEMDKKI